MANLQIPDLSNELMICPNLEDKIPVWKRERVPPGILGVNRLKNMFEGKLYRGRFRAQKKLKTSLLFFL